MPVEVEEYAQHVVWKMGSKALYIAVIVGREMEKATKMKIKFRHSTSSISLLYML